MGRPPLRRRRRWLRRILLTLLLLVLLPMAALALALWRTLPPESADLRLPGLAAPVSVAMDAQGIPRIRAQSERDALVALGWLHARDRLFQMELMRRGAAGRLAEIAGPAGLRNDRFVRTLGLLRRAEADLAAYPEEARDALEAYALGVNAWIEARGRFAAPEFLWLGTPEPWRPEHSLLWGKVMGVWLSGDWRGDLARGRLATQIPPERVAELWPTDATPGRPDLVEAAGRAASLFDHHLFDAGHLARLAAAVPRFPEPGTLPSSASNSWAVAGSRSASGGALLANDPHLGFNAPILWYLARIDLADGRMLAGATSPGVPYVVIGRNNRLAWGFTTTHSDTQDLFVERLAGPDAYQTPEGPRPFAVRQEIIRVRGADPVTIRVRETRHGPVVSDLDDQPQQNAVLAVAMANLAEADTAGMGLQALNRAGSIEAGRAAAALITSPPQNLMLADADGAIALVLTGRVPVRRAGDGSVPTDGATGAGDWTGWVAFEDLPHQMAPETGLLANGNNRVAPPDWPAFLGSHWFGDWRFRRIGTLLGQLPRPTAADFAAMQNDIVSARAQELAPVIAALPRPDGAAGAALDLLRHWDGSMAPGRPQPLIFNAWMRQIARRAQAAGGVPAGAWVAGPEFTRALLADPRGLGAFWCQGDCTRLAAEALGEAVAALQPGFGPDPANWQWGQAHVARFIHPALGQAPVIGRFLRLETPTGGDAETISRGGMRGGGGIGEAAGYSHLHGAGLRLVADLSDPEATLAIIATGQSGHPLSRHWGDLLPLWRDGQVLRLTRQPAAAAGLIQLSP